jgi:hypothetical protein
VLTTALLLAWSSHHYKHVYSIAVQYICSSLCPVWNTWLKWWGVRPYIYLSLDLETVTEHRLVLELWRRVFWFKKRW